MSELRERKRAALRETIVRTAVGLFVEHGYDAVSVGQIVHACMCSRSTFHRYFGAKEDVLFPAAEDVVAGLRVDLSTSAASRGSGCVDPWLVARQAVTEQLARFLDALESDLRATCVRLWFSESAPKRRYLEIAHEWEEIVGGYFAAVPDADRWTRFDIQFGASAITSAVRAAMHAAIDTGDDVRTLMDSAFERLESGFRPAGGVSAPSSRLEPFLGVSQGRDGSQTVEGSGTAQGTEVP